MRFVDSYEIKSKCSDVCTARAPASTRHMSLLILYSQLINLYVMFDKQYFTKLSRCTYYAMHENYIFLSAWL